MSLSEWVTAIVPLVTLLVVAVTAYAALRQIGHLRTANETLAILELNKVANTPQFEQSRQYVHWQLSKDIEDAALRQLYLQPRNGDRGPIAQAACYCDFEYAWKDGRALARLERQHRGNDHRIYEMFEALAMTQRRYCERRGTASFYPAGLPRDAL